MNFYLESQRKNFAEKAFLGVLFDESIDTISLAFYDWAILILEPVAGFKFAEYDRCSIG